ncbi:MAG: hypothetical protein M0036_11815 [Desulfobacteraceae bacterium]|nr:hypothetical protein [Desulfobacteraceae bacterium]
MEKPSKDLYYSYSPQKAWTQWVSQAMQPLFGGNLAPDALAQSILPGWTFANVVNVTEQNSSSPETERDVVAQQSYGKQLGRLMDAVMALIDELPKNARQNEAFDKLRELSEKINNIKKGWEPTRLRRLKEELESLRLNRPEEYRRIASDLVENAAALQTK